MKAIFKWSAALALLGLVFGLGMRVGGHRSDPSARDLPVVATVNGVDLSQSDLKLALVRYRRQALEDLVADTLLLQAARERGLTLPPEVDPTPGGELLADEALALARQSRAQKVRRELALAGFSEVARHEAFEAMGLELRRYWLVVIGLKHEDDYPILQRELEGGASFDSLVPKYTIQLGLPENGHLDEVARSTVSQRLGPYVAESLLQLKQGQVSEPLPSPLGPVVIKVVRIKQGYAELKNELDEALVESEALALDFQLGSQSLVTSAYVPELKKKSTLLAEKPLEVDKLKPIAALGPNPPFRPQGSPVRQLQGQPLKDPAPPITLKPSKKTFIGQVKTETSPGVIKATLEKVSHRVLPARLDQQPVLRLDTNDNHHADDFEPVLVKVTPAGWKKVAEISESLDRYRLEHDYGYWTDPRPNSAIEAAKVKLLGLQADKSQPHLFEVGVEIRRDDAGRLFQTLHLARYSLRSVVDKQDLLRLNDYRDTGANWSVSER